MGGSCPIQNSGASKLNKGGSETAKLYNPDIRTVPINKIESHDEETSTNNWSPYRRQRRSSVEVLLHIKVIVGLILIGRHFFRIELRPFTKAGFVGSSKRSWNQRRGRQTDTGCCQKWTKSRGYFFMAKYLETVKATIDDLCLKRGWSIEKPFAAAKGQWLADPLACITCCKKNYSGKSFWKRERKTYKC